MLTLTRPATAPLSHDDTRLVEASQQALMHFLASPLDDAAAPVRLSLERPDGQRTEIALPAVALPLLVSLLTELSQGKQVALVTAETEITTQQAADFLHVSRPYLVKLIDAGKIPARKVGVRRRVKLNDLLRYMEETGDAAARAIDEMVAENQRLGLYS